MRTSSLCRAVPVAAMAMLIGLGCEKTNPPPPAVPAAPLGYIPKCPQHPFEFEVAEKDSTEAWVKKVVKTVALSGELTPIVEVHDCQRLIVSTIGPDGSVSSSSYGPTATVFAGSTISALLRQTPDERPTRAAAVIYSWGEGDDPASGDYPTLGIKGGWNCLYVFMSSGRPAATMVSVPQDTFCLNPPQEAGTRLKVVTRAPPSGMTGDDIPAVARWGWARSKTAQRNHIWIRCGDMACEIGPGDFEPEPELPADAKSKILAITGISTAKRRVVEFRGWYDQQLLAEPDGAEGLKVGGVLATLVPSPDLGAMNNVQDFDNWQRVAFAYLPDDAPTYAEKLNLRKGVNVIYLRRGAKESVFASGEKVERDCEGEDDNTADPWWAKVESPSGAVKYYCVHRWVHPTAGRLPGTVRWRWLRDDEKTWIRCPGGCCPIV